MNLKTSAFIALATISLIGVGYGIKAMWNHG